MDFKDLNELKERVMPALKKRENDFKILGKNITVDEIWNSLITDKWRKSHNLKLNDIVNDILKFNA